MAVGCRGRCFRVLTLHGWVFDAKAQLTQLEICPDCLGREVRARKKAYFRHRDETERLKGTPGGLDHVRTDDAFDGFRKP